MEKKKGKLGKGRKTGIEKCKKENKKIYFIKKEKRRKIAAKFEIPFFSENHKPFYLFIFRFTFSERKGM